MPCKAFPGRGAAIPWSISPHWCHLPVHHTLVLLSPSQTPSPTVLTLPCAVCSSSHSPFPSNTSWKYPSASEMHWVPAVSTSRGPESQIQTVPNYFSLESKHSQLVTIHSFSIICSLSSRPRLLSSNSSTRQRRIRLEQTFASSGNDRRGNSQTPLDLTSLA